MDKMTKTQNLHATEKKSKEGRSGEQHFNPSTPNFSSQMSRQPDSHFRMANHLSHIGYLIKGPTVNRSGLGDLLWHIQWEPPQNLHPTTKEICEQIIHYITEGATNNEQSTYNKNMELLSNTLEDITKIIMSESPRKRIDLLNLYINKEKEAQQPQQNETINMIRTTIQAIIDHLFNTSRARIQLPTTSQKEEGDQQVPKGTEEEEEKHLH